MLAACLAGTWCRLTVTYLVAENQANSIAPLQEVLQGTKLRGIVHLSDSESHG